MLQACPLRALRELRFTGNGTTVTTFRVGATPRYQDQRGQWKDGDTLFITCVAWRQLADNIAESLSKGMRVIVSGRLTQRSYNTEDGKRTVYEVQADEVGPSLRTVTAKVTRASRGQVNGNGSETEFAPVPGDGEPPF
jgi:single-strand DNA-binding protein